MRRLDMSLKLSIIIPVYNVEAYIARCLDSVLQQDLSHDEYEIIVVNDGTPDDSMSIVNDYQNRFSNIRVIDRKNGGLSVARNTGLDNARGKYVWFVDSDDWIEPHSIKSVFEFAETHHLDAMGFFFQYAYEDGSIGTLQSTAQYPDTVLSGEEFVAKTHFLCSPWAYIYRAVYLQENSLRFKEGILHEDEEFSPRAHFLCKHIAYTKKVVYNYFQRQGSIMKSTKNEERVRSFLSICDSLYEFKEKYVAPDSIALSFFINKIIFSFTQALSHFASLDSKDLSQFKNKPYYPLPLNSKVDRGLIIKGLMINCSMALYLNLLRLNKLIHHK